MSVAGATVRAMTTLTIDWTEQLSEQLEWHWSRQLRPRFAGLSDDEYLWEPAQRGRSCLVQCHSSCADSCSVQSIVSVVMARTVASATDRTGSADPAHRHPGRHRAPELGASPGTFV